MKLIISLIFASVALTRAMPPRGPSANIDPNMRKAILDMIMGQLQRDPQLMQNFMVPPNQLMNLMGTLGNPSNNNRPQRPPMGGNNGGFPPQNRPPPNFNFGQNFNPYPPQPYRPPHSFIPPGNVFMGPRPRPQPRPTRPAPNNNGLLMDIPGGNAAGGYGGMAGSYAFHKGAHCPPAGQLAFTSSDTCKDKIIYEALYNKRTGKPLYSWVPPANMFDPFSIPDNVKDHAMNILIQKVATSKKPATMKQKELMRALGDPPNHAKHMFGMLY